jgi:hypothetical protein
MLGHSQSEGGSPAGRLERWLVGNLGGGVLRGLPRYHPVRGVAGECAERYARLLLEGLRSDGAGLRTLERVKDDGRAFRSWAELALNARATAPTLALVAC